MSDWLSDRATREEFIQAGWRQHWLQMWGFVGQQYLADCRYFVIKKTLLNTAKKPPVSRRLKGQTRVRRNRH